MQRFGLQRFGLQRFGLQRFGLQRLACGAAALFFIPWAQGQAQDLTINDLKGRIFDARMAQQTFANGLRFCSELNGTNFYFQPRNRVLGLADYRRALDDLARAQVYNPQTRRPWSAADANQRWEEVKAQAVRDKENCALVASLPQLQQRLEQMESAQAGSQKKD